MRILALDLGGSAIKHGLVENGRLVNGYQTSPSHGKQGGDALLAAAEKVVATYSGYQRIGVCSAGQIDPGTGYVTFANDNIPHYTGTDLRGFFQTRFHVPVAVENDVNAMAIGEGAWGAAQGYSDYLCLAFGTGIGGAIVLDGKVYPGIHHCAGELGHLITHVGGRPCTCGGRGCYEQYASAGALTRAAEAENLPHVTAKEILAHPENTLAQKVLRDWQQELVAGLLSVIYTFNPACVVLGGAVMENPGMLQQIEGKLRGQLMASFSDVHLLAARLGNAAGMLGIAHLAQRLKI